MDFLQCIHMSATETPDNLSTQIGAFMTGKKGDRNDYGSVSHMFMCLNNYFIILWFIGLIAISYIWLTSWINVIYGTCRLYISSDRFVAQNRPSCKSTDPSDWEFEYSDKIARMRSLIKSIYCSRKCKVCDIIYL